MSPAQKAWQTRQQRESLKSEGFQPETVQMAADCHRRAARLRRNAAARARYQLCKDLGLSRNRDGSWE